MQKDEGTLLSSFLPKSFGSSKHNKAKSTNEQLQATKRITKAQVKKRLYKECLKDDEGSKDSPADGPLSMAEATKAIISEDAAQRTDNKGYIVVGSSVKSPAIEEEMVEVEFQDEGDSSFDALLPLSHEIKLKGHSKVNFLYLALPRSIITNQGPTWHVSQ